MSDTSAAPKALKTAPSGIIEKVALTLVRDQALLFARSKGQTLFYTLGGKIDEGETQAEALMRESDEEGDIQLLFNTIEHLHTFEGPCHGYVEGTVLKMYCYDADYIGMLTPRNEVEELAWFTTADMHRTTPMGQEILRWFNRQGLIA